MRCCRLFMALMFWVIGPAVAGQTHFDPSSFNTKATFSVDSDVLSLTSAVATIEARPNAPGYSWLRISFYSFPPAAEDIASVVSGNVESLDRKWSKKASNPKDYNHSHAVLQLSVDKGQKISQVDMSVPGHACTIAPFEQDIKNAWQTYQFDGKHLRLKSKGSYICDMKFMGIPNQKFGWDVEPQSAGI